MCKQRMRLGCNRSKTDLALHNRSTFSAPCLDLQAPRLPPGGSLGIPKILGTSAHIFQDRYVYTAITDSAVPKNCQYGANILGCRANFLVRVNGVLIIRRARKVSTDRIDHIRTNSLNKNIAGRDRCSSIPQPRYNNSIR